MKTILIIAGMLMMSSAAFAQFNIGPMLVYGTDTDLGFGVKAEFSVAEKLTISPSFALLSNSSIDFLGVDIKTSISELNADAHYSLSDNGSINWYGLGGLNVAFATVKAAGESESASEVGLNLGGGAKFGISDSIKGFAQAKYIVSEASQLGIHAGIYFSLGGN